MENVLTDAQKTALKALLTGDPATPDKPAATPDKLPPPDKDKPATPPDKTPPPPVKDK